MKYKVKPTLTITVNNNAIPIAGLPENLREEIEHFDMLLQDQANAAYELDKIGMAIQYKNSIISQLITAHFTAPKVDESKKGQTAQIEGEKPPVKKTKTTKQPK